ncbi:unnamed protein product [Rotaria sp. Silwood1]|nr:unnamed protein product [Rotaria sp. Silwood1]
MQIYIHDMEPGKNHTLQIIAKLNNGKETTVSDLINFTVPSKKNQQTDEVINVVNESVPLRVLGYIVKNDDTNNEQLEEDRSKKNASRLLRILESQIHESRKC